MLKDWLLQIFITFGLGLMLGLIFNSGNPLLTGLQAASAVAMSTAIVARFKKLRFHKTSATLRSQIARLQKKSHALQHNILTATAEKTQIASELDSYSQRRQAAEQHISALETARQRMIAESQQVKEQLTSLQEERHSLQDSVAKIAINRQQLLGSKPEPIAELSNSRQQLAELQAEIARLKSEEQNLAANITQLHSDRQQLLTEQQAQQGQSHNFQQQQELEERELSNVLAQLTAQKMKSISESRQLEADIAQLATHKQSLQLELEQLQHQIVELHQIGSSPEPEIEQSMSAPIADHHWPELFEDEMIRSVFVQLQEYGSVTEAELTQMLAGNPRKARQFALKFEEYLQLVPFNARVEIAASGKRYVRE
jgi:DNA repair exonuclease SbcCD ATPase subunit